MKEFSKQKQQVLSSKDERRRASLKGVQGQQFDSLLRLSEFLTDRSEMMDALNLPFYDFFVLTQKARFRLSALCRDVALQYSGPSKDAILLLTDHLKLFTDLMEPVWPGSCTLFSKASLRAQTNAVIFCDARREYSAKLLGVGRILADEITFPKVAIKRDRDSFILVNASNSAELERFVHPNQLLADTSAIIRAFRDFEYNFVDAVYGVIESDSPVVVTSVKALQRTFVTDWSSVITKWSLIDKPIRR